MTSHNSFCLGLTPRTLAVDDVHPIRSRERRSKGAKEMPSGALFRYLQKCGDVIVITLWALRPRRRG